MRKFIVMTAAAAFMVACDSATDPAVYPEWTGELEGATGYEQVEGDVEVKSKGSTFTAKIDVSGAAQGAYKWEVAGNTCADPGNRVGAAATYTDLNVGEGGTASRNVTVTGTLNGTAKYHAAVFRVVDDERVNVACADLVRDNS